MSWLFENPTWLIVGAIAAEIALGVALLKTGRGETIWGMVGVALLLVCGLVVEKLVVTETEEIEAVMQQASAALESNQVDAVLKLVDDQASDMRERVRWGMSLVKFSTIRFSNLKVTFDPSKDPVTAKADFIGMAWFEDPRQEIPHDFYMRRFVVTFEHRPEGWVMVEYEVGDAKGGPTTPNAY